MSLPPDYVERVYAGVLGKLIGVYLGRPFENWSYDQISRTLGEVNYFVHERFDVPLIVTDDDISGTFTFLRALPDYDNRRDLTPTQIGQTWLNYIIERRTILWWGGMGNSTEHTAYLRLKRGIEAPASGSMALNGKVVAEQIGAQIFIDGWGMVAPGDPDLAADLARRAASVSHDGEAIYGAQVIAAMLAQAFVEQDLNRLLDTATGFIPKDSLIYALINDVRTWHAAEPDWRTTRERIAGKYGYDRYGGNCHIIPNHALIIHALLYGDDNFQKSLMIVNTCGWDTDCNSGNVGCLLGVKNGLAGIDQGGPDWRTPVADRLYLATADGGRAITDALTEAYHIVSIGQALNGQPHLAPKNGARYHFEAPGAVQGFQAEESPEVRGVVTVTNVAGGSQRGRYSLALRCQGLAPGRRARVATPTFIPSRATADYFQRRGYALYASPTLYPGQTVNASVQADPQNGETVGCNLYVQVYGEDDQLLIRRSPAVQLAPGATHTFTWRMEATGGDPIAAIGVELSHERRADGVVYLDYLTWSGEPDVTFFRPAHNGEMWRFAWVDAVDQYTPRWPEAYRLAQNEGRGLLIQGTREWGNYEARATITPHLVKSTGIAVRVQGLRRFYALLLCDDQHVRLVKALDGDQVLAETPFEWQLGEPYDFCLAADGTRLTAQVDGQTLFTIEDQTRPLLGGAVALVCEEGRAATDAVVVRPVADLP
jgi:ADP-ribosylglycohydrolase